MNTTGNNQHSAKTTEATGALDVTVQRIDSAAAGISAPGKFYNKV